MPRHHRRHRDQVDLFDEVQMGIPVRAPTTLLRALDFNRRIAMAMAEAIRVCGKDRKQIADEMSQVLGLERPITEHMLNAYTAVAREDHTISLVRFLAFVRVTGCNWLWDVVLHDEGLTILEGAEARLAQAALYRKQGEELLARAEAALADAPATVRVRRGSR